ncbi:MAG: hypothetical protein GY870_02040 [archaeon]|nr:hypothetical protein [archaeon]
MKLFEVFRLNRFEETRRVPGGWVITRFFSNGDDTAIAVSNVFIPFDNEFMKREPCPAEFTEKT